MVNLNHLNDAQRHSKMKDPRNGRRYTTEQAHQSLDHIKDDYKVGELICLSTNVILPQPIVDQYNAYAKLVNGSHWRPDQEYFLDNRHRFITQIMAENLKQQTLGKLPPFSQ